MDQIPSSFYIIVGSLILANIGTVVTVIYGLGKLVWWLSALNSRVETVEKITADGGPIYKDINAAHSGLRDIRNEITQRGNV